MYSTPQLKKIENAEKIKNDIEEAKKLLLSTKTKLQLVKIQDKEIYAINKK